MTNLRSTTARESTGNRSRLGLPVPAIILLAAVAAPRVVLHDLGLITEGTFVNALFVFVPLVLWIAVVLWRRVPHPFLTLLTVGAVYGVFLLLGHQILWDRAFDGNPVQLGGNLAGLNPGTQEVIIRVFSGGSNLVTGLLVGAVTGAVAWAISRALQRRAVTIPRG